MGKDTKHTSKTTPKTVDWRGGHGPVTGAINATAGVLAATVVANTAGIGPEWAAAGGAAGAIGTVTAAARNAATGALTAFRTGCWIAAGTWSTWTLAAGDPTDPAALGSLAAGGILGGTLAAGARAHEETEQSRRGVIALRRRRAALAEEWIDRLERVCRITGTEIPAIEQWTSGHGYTVEVQLPAGGTTRRAVADRADALASDLDLPDGCGVQVLPGVSRRRALILVRTRSMAGTERPFPLDDIKPIETIINPVPIAELPTGNRVDLDLRQASTIVSGGTGTGKTNWLRSVMCRLLGCNDVLIWCIDFNGGGLGLPFLTAWRDAQTSDTPETVPAPGVDWLASTPAEAGRMLDAAVRIAKARKAAYHDRMTEADDDKLPIGPDLPEIIIVVDEGAEVAGGREARQVMARLAEVIRIARAMAVRAIISVLRVTQDVLPDPMVRKMASNRVCTGTSEDSELGHLFGWRALSAENSFDGPGTLLVGVDGKQPNPSGGWRVVPSTITEVCRLTADRRPELDQPSLDAAGTDYHQRWWYERCGHLWNTNTTTPASTEAPPPPGSPDRPWKATAHWDQETTPENVDVPGVDLLQKMFDAPSANERHNSTDNGDDFDPADPTTWRAHRTRPSSTPDPDHTSGAQADARTAALMLIIAAGPDGTGASAMERTLRPDFGTTRQTIVGWLKEWAETGEVIRAGTGTKTRYVHHKHATEN